MTQDTNTNAPASPPVALAAVALEMGDTTPDALEREIGAEHVFVHGGFRSVTAFRARELLEAHHRRKEEAALQAARNAERSRKTVSAAHARIPKGFTKFEMGATTINPGGDGVLPVVAMTANADTDFEGGTYTKRPSRFDWLLGKGEGGGVIGPSAEQIKRGKKGKKS